MTLPELIAIEVMNAIERERRINKDDLIMAAEVAIGKFSKAHPLVMVASEMMKINWQDGSASEFLTLASGELPSHSHSFVTATTTTTKPGCVSSAEAAQEALAALCAGIDHVNSTTSDLPSAVLWIDAYGNPWTTDSLGRLVLLSSTNCTN